jgi:hypothetical protein
MVRDMSLGVAFRRHESGRCLSTTLRLRFVRQLSELIGDLPLIGSPFGSCHGQRVKSLILVLERHAVDVQEHQRDDQRRALVAVQKSVILHNASWSA